jgi:hypothetical protein
VYSRVCVIHPGRAERHFRGGEAYRLALLVFLNRLDPGDDQATLLDLNDAAIHGLSARRSHEVANSSTKISNYTTKSNTCLT